MRSPKKNILIRIFEGFLWHFGLWKPFYKLFWKPTSIEKYGSLIYQNEVNDIGGFKTDFLWSELSRKSFENQNKRWKTQNESIYSLNEESLIEPSQGLILIKENKLIETSRIHDYVFPHVSLKFLLKFKKKIRIEEAYFFEGYVGESYYHFFCDTMASYYLFNSICKSETIPLVVHKKTYFTKHFQYFLKNSDLSKREIIIVKDNPILVKKLFISKGAFSIKYWKTITQKFSYSNPQNAFRKIFLNRNKNVGRNIINLNEVISLVKELGFEIVDTEFLSMEDQIILLQQSKLLVGIHGAGLTNIIFANQTNFSLIEINPVFKGEEDLRPHYYWLSQCLGLKYQCLEGGILDDNQKFYINIETLKKYIINLK